MSANNSDASLPTPEPGEPSDVSVALEAARALWDNGETDEALRWFSRAVEAAEQAGNDRRALDLARAVAELKDGLAKPKPGAPPTAPPKSSTPAAPTKSVAAPPPPSARRGLPPTPPSMRPRAPETAKPTAHERELLPYEKPRSTPPGAAPKASTPLPPAAALPKAGTPSSKLPAPPPAASAAAPPTPAAQSPAVTNAGERLRVSVKSSVRDPDLLLVRVLKSGQAVPAGYREAFLSPAQSGVDLRSLRE